jgi:hypothetical protein
MSTLLESALDSDVYGATPPSQTPRPTDAPSSSRPRPPPSLSNGLPSDADLFPDDEIVGAASGRVKNPLDRNVSQVVDTAGERVQQAFEDFLESHVEEPSATGLPPSSELKTDKYYINQVHGLRESCVEILLATNSDESQQNPNSPSPFSLEPSSRVCLLAVDLLRSVVRARFALGRRAADLPSLCRLLSRHCLRRR